MIFQSCPEIVLKSQIVLKFTKKPVFVESAINHLSAIDYLTVLLHIHYTDYYQVWLLGAGLTAWNSTPSDIGYITSICQISDTATFMHTLTVISGLILALMSFYVAPSNTPSESFL